METLSRMFDEGQLEEFFLKFFFPDYITLIYPPDTRICIRSLARFESVQDRVKMSRNFSANQLQTVRYR